MKSAQKIGIDLRLWGHPGIGRYIRELTAAMIALQGAQSFQYLGYPADLEVAAGKFGGGFSGIKVYSKIYSVSEQWEIAVKSRNMGLLHVPHFNIPVMYRGKLVVTVHDLIYLRDAKASKSRWGKPYAEFLFRYIGKKAAAILTVSEYTKNDLLNFFPEISPEKVFVTHQAASPLFFPVHEPAILDSTRKRFGFSKPFVLFVGSLKEHKNIPVLIRAVLALRSEKKMEIELVIVGRRDPKNKELWNKIQENSSSVKYLGELPDADLALLYNLADVFVLPSYREGFGLPVIEAMACGVPVIVSNRASLPEIAGGAGLVFDPDRVDELSALMYNVISDRLMRKNLSEQGIARAAHFSWENTAQKTMEVYDKVLR